MEPAARETEAQAPAAAALAVEAMVVAAPEGQALAVEASEGQELEEADRSADSARARPPEVRLPARHGH